MTLSSVVLGSLLLGVCFGEFAVVVPQTLKVMRGSCVTIPCSFSIPKEHDKNLKSSCKGYWKNWHADESRDLTAVINGKDCTTTITNVNYSDQYYFRLECNNPLKYSFLTQVSIIVQDHPPNLILTPPSQSVGEGTSVTLTCSTEAPCWTHPPSLTWTSGLGDSQETLQRNYQTLSSKTSVLSFDASYKHDGKEIFCIAVHKKQDGTSVIEKQLTKLSVSYSPKETKVLVSASGPVTENSSVSLTCSSKAKPPVTKYSWYRVEGKVETLIKKGQKLNLNVSRDNKTIFCKAENNFGVQRSTLSQFEVQFPSTTLSLTEYRKTASHSGNLSPTVYWVFVNGRFGISIEHLNSTNIKSVITFEQHQETDLSALLSPLESTNHTFSVAKDQDQMFLLMLIATNIFFLSLVFILLCIIRKQKTHKKTSSTQIGNENEGPSTGEATNDGSGTKGDARDVIYTSVKRNAKQQVAAAERMSPDEKDGAGCSKIQILNIATPTKLRKGAECEYAQVKYKHKRAFQK